MYYKRCCSLATVLVAVLHLYRVHARYMYQGDIVLTREQQATLEANSNTHDPFSPQDAVVKSKRSLWPNAVVPYVIDRSLGNQSLCNTVCNYLSVTLKQLLFCCDGAALFMHAH